MNTKLIALDSVYPDVKRVWALSTLSIPSFQSKEISILLIVQVRRTIDTGAQQYSISQYNDNTLAAYQLPQASPTATTPAAAIELIRLWVREEAFSSVIDAVVHDLPVQTTHVRASNSSHSRLP